MKQRAVPPVVHFEEAVIASPGRLASRHPADAVLRASLHLHHVGHGMVRPAIERLEVERAAASVLRARVIAGLLETERVHRHHRVIAGNVRGPVRHDARDSIAQVACAAAIEIHQVADLQTRQVAGVTHVVEVHRAGRRDPVAGEHLFEARQLRRLSLVERHRADGGGDVACLRRCRRLGGQREDERLEQVRLGERRGIGDGLVEARQRVPAVDVEASHRGVEQRSRARRRTGESVRLTIGDHLVPQYIAVGHDMRLPLQPPTGQGSNALRADRGASS